MESGPERLTDLPVLVEQLQPRLDALVMCLSHSWGGLEQVAAQDALDAGALGLKMRVMVLEGTPIHEHLAKHAEVKTLPLPFRPRNHFDFGMRSELQRRIVEGTNLIHTHQPSLLGSIVPWLWGSRDIALLASRHIMNNHNKRDPYHRMIYRRIDAFIVMSQTLRENVAATHALRERQLKVVNLGLDFARFNPAQVNAQEQRARWGADDKTIVIGLVGRIDPAKGQATFIRAAAGLTKNLREGEKVKFVIVGEETLGSTSNHLQELKQMVTQFRLDDYVVFDGFRKNIPEVMKAMDIFVMPSRQEAFGLVAIEAMAMECPIVISSGGSAEEIVGQEQYGLMIRPDDAFDLQQKLRHMIDHPEMRVQMGKGGRERVTKNYDRKNRLRRTLEIYERALRRRGSV